MFTMKYQKISSSLFIIVLIMGTFSAYSQGTADTLKQNNSENVTIYGTSRPVIRRAYKINKMPKLTTMKLPVSHFNDNFGGQETPTKISLQSIKPTLIKEYIKGSNWDNVVRVGLGSRISPYAEFFHSSGIKSSYRLNAHLYHYSSFKNIKNYLPSPYSRTLAEVGFHKYFEYHVLGLQASYSLNTNRYYGHNTSKDTISYNKNSSQFKQDYQLGSFSADFASNYRNFDKLHYLIRATTYYFSNKHGTSELHAGLDFDFHKAFQVSNLFNHQQLGFEGVYSFYQEKNSYYGDKEHYVRALPYFDAKYGSISFKAGLNVQWLMSNAVKLHFYPYLDVKLSLLSERLSLFAGLKGGMKKNSFKELSKQNPYLSSYDNYFRWQNNKIVVYGGFKGNIAKKLNFELRAGYKTFQDMAFFDYPTFINPNNPIYSTANPVGFPGYFINAFNIHYSGGNMVELSGGLTYVNSQTLKIWLLGNYNHYNLSHNYLPLYKPLKEVRLGCAFKINSKIRPWFEVYYMGTRWASHQFLGSAVAYGSYFYELPSYLDINFGGNYQIDKQLSAFLKVSNLLNQQYKQFNEYPVAGLEVMLGAAYRF